MSKLGRLARLQRGRRRRAMTRLTARVLREEDGGETLEYAVVAGLIVTGAIATIQCVGTKVLARWQTLNSSL
jgi:Flp pilus assembly pilin Flp